MELKLSHLQVIILTRPENQSTKDLLQMPIGPITRARVKKLQEALNGLVKGVYLDQLIVI